MIQPNEIHSLYRSKDYLEGAVNHEYFLYTQISRTVQTVKNGLSREFQKTGTNEVKHQKLSAKLRRLHRSFDPKEQDTAIKVSRMIEFISILEELKECVGWFNLGKANYDRTVFGFQLDLENVEYNLKQLVS